MNLFVELIQVSLGNRDGLSRVPSAAEWRALYEEAERQAIAGVLLKGVEKLFDNHSQIMIHFPLNLKMTWIATAQIIRAKNRQMDDKTAAVWRQLKEDGMEAVVLKGQGVAAMYVEKIKDGSNEHTENIGTLRQSGDIDIWVKGGFNAVCEYVQRKAPTDDVAYHRFHYPIFDDTDVELHFRPTLMRNLFDNRKLARWYEHFGANSFEYLEEKGFAVPSAEFNRVFLLTHIYRHFLFEGIGLKQVMDYYFVLRGKMDDTDVIHVFKSLRLLRFAEAMMWLLHTQFGLEKKYLICGTNEKEGRFLLNEILLTGNFGFSDERYQYKRWFKLRHHIAHGSHLLFHYPSEVLWTPIWLMYHKVWKWKKKRMIRNKERKKEKNCL